MKIVKDLTQIAIFAAVIIVLEYALYFLPNIQLTFFLLILFSKVLGFKKTSVIIIIYTVIDYMIIGGISLFTPFVLIALIMIPLTLTTVFKKVEEPIYLAFLGILYSFIYSLLYVLATVLINEVNFIAYLASDIIFEVILAASTFISVLWLYTPLKKFLDEKL